MFFSFPAAKGTERTACLLSSFLLRAVLEAGFHAQHPAFLKRQGTAEPF